MTSLPVRRVQSVTVDETWIRRLAGLPVRVRRDRGFRAERRGPWRALQGRDRAAGQARGDPPAHAWPDARGRGVPGPTLAPSRGLRFYIVCPTVSRLLIAVPVIGVLAVFFPPGAIAVGSAAVVVALVVACMRVLNWRAAGIGTDQSALTVRTRRHRTQAGAPGSQPHPITARTADAVPAARGTRDAHSLLGLGFGGGEHSVSHLPLADAERVVEWFREGIEGTRPA